MAISNWRLRHYRTHACVSLSIIALLMGCSGKKSEGAKKSPDTANASQAVKSPSGTTGEAGKVGSLKLAGAKAGTTAGTSASSIDK